MAAYALDQDKITGAEICGPRVAKYPRRSLRFLHHMVVCVRSA